MNWPFSSLQAQSLHGYVQGSELGIAEIWGLRNVSKHRCSHQVYPQEGKVKAAFAVCPASSSLLLQPSRVDSELFTFLSSEAETSAESMIISSPSFSSLVFCNLNVHVG